MGETMRLGRLFACAVPLLVAAALAVPAAADTSPPTLYVAPSGQGNDACSDSWPGTYTQPLCTIQAAADIVVPGQTVIVDINVSNLHDDENVHITRSGTPAAPIVFKTGDLPPDPGEDSSVTLTGGFTVEGAHDVAIEGFAVNTTDATGITIADSSDITIDRAVVENDRIENTSDAVDISGDSSDVTVSRTRIGDFGGSAITVGPGVSGTDLAGDIVFSGGKPAISVDGAADTDITNDTAAYANGGCPPPSFAISGGATGTSIENNLTFDSCGTAPLLSVSADSAAGTHADYNLVHDDQPNPGLYSWAGTNYASASALSAATGQGTHDLNTAQRLSTGYVPLDKSPAVDSGDADAPGILPTDYDGSPHVDDPNVVNTGTGSGTVDRGAVELPDPMTLSVSLSSAHAPTGGTETVTLKATPGWGPITGYTVDFGDGTAPTTSTSPTITHVYDTVRSAPYQITASVTDSLGDVLTKVQPILFGVTVVPPAPLVPVLHVTLMGAPSPPGAYVADVIDSTDSWSLTSATCDFGDGTGVQQAQDLACDHTFRAPGTYLITMTVTDGGGNTATATQQLYIPPARNLPQPVSGGGSCKVCY